MKIPLYKVIMGREERSAVDRVLVSGKLAQGRIVEEFEKKFAKFIGVKYACATLLSLPLMPYCRLALDPCLLILTKKLLI